MYTTKLSDPNNLFNKPPQEIKAVFMSSRRFTITNLLFT